MTQLGQTKKRGLQCHSQRLVFLYRCRCYVNGFMLRQQVNTSRLLRHFTGEVGSRL